MADQILVPYWTISNWEGLPRGQLPDRKGVAGNVLVRAWQRVCFSCCEEKIFSH